MNRQITLLLFLLCLNSINIRAEVIIQEPIIKSTTILETDISVPRVNNILVNGDRISLIYSGSFPLGLGNYIDRVDLATFVYNNNYLEIEREEQNEKVILIDSEMDSINNQIRIYCNNLNGHTPSIHIYDTSGVPVITYKDENENINRIGENALFRLNDTIFHFNFHRIVPHKFTIAKYDEQARLFDTITIDTSGINPRIAWTSPLNGFQMDKSGNFYIVFKNTAPNRDTYSILVKFTNNGKFLWYSEIKHPYYETTSLSGNFEICPDDYIYFRAYHWNKWDEEAIFSVSKLNSNGDIIWRKEENIDIFKYDNGNFSWLHGPYHFKFFNDKYIALSGVYVEPVEIRVGDNTYKVIGNHSFWIRFYDFDGHIVEEYKWYVEDLLDHSNGITSVTQAPNGNLYVAGGGLNKVVLFEIESHTVSVPQYNYQIKQSQLSIHPNPAGDILHIEDGSPNSEIEIYSVLGIVQLKLPYSASIDVSRLPAGVYFLRSGVEYTVFVKD